MASSSNSSDQLRLDEVRLTENQTQSSGAVSALPVKTSAQTTEALNGMSMNEAIPSLRTVDDDTAQSSTMPERTTETPTAFRFLDLPSEIRNQIYEEVLTCNEFARDIEVEYSPCERSPDSESIQLRREPIFVDHQVTAALLRTNRQIYYEACRVMMARNFFVRLTIVDSEELDKNMRNFCIPILAQGLAACQFRSPAIDMAVSGRIRGTEESLDSHPTYVVLAASLGRIADLIKSLTQFGFWSSRLLKELRLFPPGGETHKDQRALWQHLGEFDAIVGNPEYLSKIGPWPSADILPHMWTRQALTAKIFVISILDGAKMLIRDGNTYYRRRAFRLAGRYYEIAAARLRGKVTDFDGMFMDLQNFFKRSDSEDYIYAIGRLQCVVRCSGSATAWELAKLNSGDPQRAEWAVLSMKANDVARRQLCAIDGARLRLDKATLDRMRARWAEADRFLESLGIHHSSSAPVWQDPIMNG